MKKWLIGKGAAILCILTLCFSMAACQPGEGNNAATNESELKVVEFQTIDEFIYHTASLVLSEGNELYSPMSLYYSTVMAAAGAEGETQEELLALLGKSSLDSLLQGTRRKLDQQILESPRVTLRFANSVWVDEQYGEIKEDYAHVITNILGGEVFSGKMSSKEMREQMKEWVAENTQGMIEYEPVGSDLSLINSVYFQSKWLLRFKPENTIEDVFVLEDGSKAKTSFMTIEDRERAYVGDNYIRADRKLSEATMVFVLPNEGTSVMDLVKDPAKLQKILEGPSGTTHVINWSVPKFTNEVQLDLGQLLSQLGIATAFSDEADYSGIAEHSDEVILDVGQKLRISIDENGVEAAGYTEYRTSTAATEHIEMTLNRPFLYAILDNNDNVLFIGTCMDPTAE